MAKTDWLKKLSTLEGAVTERRDIHNTVIQTTSPYLNFIFGKGWGLPLGYSMLLYGPQKAGKSLISLLMAGGVHRDYDDSFVIRFNSEMREGQLDTKLAAMAGVDMNRYMGLDVNNPELIYDQIEQEIASWCQDGMNLKLIIIDSMNAVQGRRDMNSESILKQQIGDVAATNKQGLKRILPILRKHGVALIMTSHVTPEMDPIEQKRNGPYKMGASVGIQHFAEYTMLVERNPNKAGRVDLLDQEFIDATITDSSEKAEITGFKTRFCMKDSSFGVKGRHGEFTWDLGRGIINAHEEVFLLGTRRGVVERPNASAYVFQDKKWTGKPAFLNALKEDPRLQEAILKELRARDQAGVFAAYDAADAKTHAPEPVEAE